MTAPLYTVAEAAKSLGIGTAAVTWHLRAAALTGRPIGRKVGNSWILDNRDLAKLARRKTQPGPVARSTSKKIVKKS